MARAGSERDPADRLSGRDVDVTLDLDVALDEARSRLETATASVEAVGEDTARDTKRYYDRLVDLMDRYEESATGTGEFQEYVAFQDALADLLSDLDRATVTDRAAFEDALDRFERRIIREKDFRRARADLEAVRDVAEAVETADRLRRRLANDRGRLSSRLRNLEHERSRIVRHIDELESVSDVDPEPLVTAVREYNDRVRDEFTTFREEAAAIEVARVGFKARLFPLAEVPPIRDEDAIEVLASSGLGSESVPTVLEYAGYSDSKLSHYVDRPRWLREHLPVSWFETVNGDAFAVALDTDAGVLCHRAPALAKVIEGFAGPETIARLRRLRDMAVDGSYERMRRAHRLAENRATTDVEAARRELSAVEEAIERVERAIDRIDDMPTLDAA